MGVRLAALVHVLFIGLLAVSDGELRAVEVTVGGAWGLMGWIEHRYRGPAVDVAHWTCHVLGVGWLALTVAVMTAGGCAWWPVPVLAAGVLLRTAAIHRLGDRYGDGIEPIGPRETGGVYRWLRHPGELGQLAIALGSALALESVLGLIVVIVVLAPISVWRMRLEDGVGVAVGA